MRRKRLAAPLLLAFFIAAQAAAEEERITLETRPGVTERVLITPAVGAPVASLILFTGGNGLLFQKNGDGLASAKNFLIRSRAKFAAQGFLVASVDAPSDQAGGMGGFRASAEHARDIAVLIAALRKRAAVPVWLVGTSMGTISAANVAARLKSGGPDGIVLTSTIVTQSRVIAPVQAVVALDQITQPTLFVHNKEDACPLCYFGAVPGVMAQLAQVSRKELIGVSGGAPPESEPCEALSRHGYIGIEDEVVGDIARWIKGG